MGYRNLERFAPAFNVHPVSLNYVVNEAGVPAMAAVRYMPADEIHYTDHGHVVTVQRWLSVNAKRPRAVYAVSRDGVRETTRLCATDIALADLDVTLDKLRGEVADLLLSDEQARQRITETTGAAPLDFCQRAGCGAVVPVGSDRCADWHSTGRVASGMMSAARRRPVIVVHTGRTTP